MKIKNILYITPNYPLPRFPERGAFVETLIRGFKGCGVETDVIAPTSIPMAIRLLKSKEEALNLSARSVSRPLYLTISKRKIAGFDARAIGEWSFLKACQQMFHHNQADVIIGKFLFGGAIAAAKLGNQYNIPAFADLGESRSFKSLSHREKKIASELFESLSGIYCVSERLAEEVIRLGADPSRILISPNEVDSKLFAPMDQQLCRDKLGIPEGVYLVSFVGHFIPRKGPLRLMEAVEKLGCDFQAMFLGRGGQVPTGDSVFYAGPVRNEDLPIWLNASDVFCLPTLSEGYCNAIEEAKACGLPIVSSDIDSVREQLEGYPALLVNPVSINDIANAIVKIRGGNYLKRQKVIINENRSSRAKKIHEWLEYITST